MTNTNETEAPGVEMSGHEEVEFLIRTTADALSRRKLALQTRRQDEFSSDIEIRNVDLKVAEMPERVMRYLAAKKARDAA